MNPRSSRSLALLALLAGLIVILERATPLCAQTVPVAQSPSAADRPAAVPDPAFVTRANATIVHSRKLIDSFFEQTSNVVCTEHISQTVVGKNNKPLYREESIFDYQLQSNSRNGSLRLTEIRESRKTAFRDPYKTLLITNGFASMLLVLHENYEPSYIFEPLTEETVDGRPVLKVHFKPIPGASSPAAVQLRGRNYSLQLKGNIWIDEESGAVVKLISSLDSNLDDLGLRELQSEIHYSIVEFHSPEEAYWMPDSAVIDVQTPKQHWRNVHRFTDFRRFRVTTQVDMGEKQP
jgi:hypothetical protein